jgi:SAM-dependent methyltransferase
MLRKILITDLSLKIRMIKMYDYVKEYNNILVIGAGGRNDWKYFEDNGLNVTVLDIRKVDGPKRFIQQSITDRTPFDNEEFDCIVLSTVLEYAIDDIKALHEVSRILKKDGLLLSDVTYVKDKTNHPVRIYSRKTLSDILKYSGFDVYYTEKQGFFAALNDKYPFRLLILLITLFIRDYSIWIKIDIYLSNKFTFFDRCFGYGEGDILKCKKSLNNNFEFYKS